MKDREIQELQEAALKEIQAAAKAEDLERLRVKYLGRKGALTQILRSLGQLDPEARRLLGREANTVKQALEEALGQALDDIKTAARRAAGPLIDVTLPGRRSQKLASDAGPSAALWISIQSGNAPPSS